MLTSAEVAERAGITYRQLDYWLRRGLLPIPDPDPGSGRRRVWDLAAVTLAWRFAALVRAGLTPEAASNIVRALDDDGAVVLTNGRVRMVVDRPPGAGLGWPAPPAPRTTTEGNR